MVAGMIGWGWQGFEPTDSRCRFPDKCVARIKLPEGPDVELVFVILHSTDRM